MAPEYLSGRIKPGLLTTFEFLPPAQKATFEVQLDISRAKNDFPLSYKWIVYFTKRGKTLQTQLERLFSSKEDFVHGFRDIQQKWSKNIQVEQIHIMRIGFAPKPRSPELAEGGSMEIQVSSEDWTKFLQLTAAVLEDKSGYFSI